jgi:indole-3-glycerol phosphate synthase
MPETQAFSAQRSLWTPPSGTLGELVAAAHLRAAAQASEAGAWRAKAAAAAPAPSFRAALRRDSVAVIAELKRRSPSRGSINPGLDATGRAGEYVGAGAAAVSVLTEPERFGGSMLDLAAVARSVAVPVLRKDFIVAPVQLYEARARGAAAALLIVRALHPEQLAELYATGTAIGLDLLVEVHDEAELGLALELGARIIGVNNRNLESLVIESGTAARIIPLIPRHVVAIAESGMASRADVAAAARSGADAVLVGSAVSAAQDPAAAVRLLADVSVERHGRPD